MGIKYSATYNNVTRDVTDASGSSFVLKYGGKDSGGNDHIIQQETISAGNGRTLSCAGKLMLGDVKVGSIKTISCGGKKAASNIVVSSQSYTPNVTLTIAGSGMYGNNREASVYVNGTQYKESATLTVPKGTTVKLEVYGTWVTNGWIQVFGTRVYKGTGGSYNVAIEQNARVDISADLWHGTADLYYV